MIQSIDWRWWCSAQFHFNIIWKPYNLANVSGISIGPTIFPFNRNTHTQERNRNHRNRIAIRNENNFAMVIIAFFLQNCDARWRSVWLWVCVCICWDWFAAVSQICCNHFKFSAFGTIFTLQSLFRIVRNKTNEKKNIFIYCKWMLNDYSIQQNGSALFDEVHFTLYGWLMIVRIWAGKKPDRSIRKSNTTLSIVDAVIMALSVEQWNRCHYK